MTAPERLTPVAEPAGERIGLDGLWLILRRQAWVILLMIIAVVAGVAAYLQTSEERYRARATLVLTLSDTRVNRTAVQLESYELSRAIVETELDVLRSRSFAAAVADSIDLPDHPAFAPPADAPPMSDDARWTMIIDRLLGSYSVFRSGESLAIEIVAETADAELTASIANGVAQTYIKVNSQRQRGEIEQSIAFLERRVRTLSDQLTAAESEMVDFIRSNGLDDDGRLDQLLAEEARLNAILSVIEQDETQREDAQRIRDELAEIDGQLRDRTRAELELLRMERAMEVQRSRYQSSGERLNQMETQLDFVPQSARQVTVARVPVEPSWPNRPVALALSFVAASGLGFVAALLMESLNRRIWSEADVLRVTGMRNLGAVPGIRRRGLFRRRHAPLLALAQGRRSVFEEAMRGVLTLWTNSRRGDVAKVLMVTSSLPGEGKSTVAVSLAGSAAIDGLRVLLVDLDPHRNGATALSGVSRQDIALEDIAPIATDVEKLAEESPLLADLDVLSLGARGRLNLHVLRTVGERLMPALRETYDLIVLDSPPVLVLDDACRLGRLADAVVLVVRWGRSSRDALRDAHERLVRNGIEVAGTVLNDVDARKLRQHRVKDYFGAAAHGGRRRARA